jgi:hypothetical protein
MRPVRCLLALVLVCLAVGVTPLVYADPPDPTWVAGFWDDDDFDDVAVLLLSTYAVVQLPLSDPGRPERVVALVECPKPSVTSGPVDAAASPRAPPLTSP